VRITQSDPIALGSSITLAALLAPPENELAWIAWVGDCRVLDVDQGTPLITPHTLTNEQLKAGLITLDEARTSPYRTS
jgi:serine/threonine protein phosphatase PrpC